MDKMDWSKIKHFKPKEFYCKCGCGSCEMHPQLVAALDMARAKAGVPFLMLRQTTAESFAGAVLL